MLWDSDPRFWLVVSFIVWIGLALRYVVGKAPDAWAFLCGKPVPLKITATSDTVLLLQKLKKGQEELLGYPCSMSGVLENMTASDFYVVEELLAGGTFWVRRADGLMEPADFGYIKQKEPA